MAHFHDLYQPGTSWIHRWHPGAKLLTLLALVFAMALVRQSLLVPVLLIVALGLYGLSQLPWGHLGRRLPYPGLFILALVGVLPFTLGETLWVQWGWLALRREGVLAAVLVAGRFLSIVITGFTLLSTTPFLAILETLRRWGLPPLLVDMTLLTYRYLHEVAEQWLSLRQGMGLRGYGVRGQLGQTGQRQGASPATHRQWGWLAAVLGSLLLRSYGRSQRIYQAMYLRGYGRSGSPAGVSLGNSPDPVTPWLTGVGLGIALGLGWLTLGLG